MNTNQITVTGNVGADPEFHRKSEDSKGVVSFNLAENVARLNEKTKKYEQTHTNWIPIKTFGSLAARVKHSLKKGARVTVFGRLRTYQYENADGVKISGFEVLADDVCVSTILQSSREGADEAIDFENF
jgi:single-strand DNA-binding protein